MNQTENEQLQLHNIDLDSFDPAAMEQTLQRSRLEHTLLSEGHFNGRLVHCATSDTSIDIGFYKLPVLATGTLAPDRVSIGLMLRAPQPCSFNAESAGIGDLMLYAEGAEIHASLCDYAHWIALQIDRSLCADVGVDFPSRPYRSLRQDPSRSARLQAVIRPALHLLGDTALDNGRDLAASIRAIDGVRDTLLCAVGELLDDRHVRPKHSTFRATANRRRLIRQAEDYIEDHIGEPITVFEICRTIDCQIHTLERAFNHVHGLGPRRFITQRRLARLRRLLLAGSVGELSVTDAILSCGFHHPGRAAAVYRSCYGEEPRATLKRTR
jgi:AraC-like DNA-binding protein